MRLAVLISHPNQKLAATAKVLKAEDVFAVRRYRAILDTAVAAASSTMEKARLEAERLKQEALRDANDTVSRMIAGAVVAGGAARQAAMAALEDDVVRLMLEALAMVLQRQPREHLIGQALDAIRVSLSRARWVNLVVHPDNEEAASLAVAQFEERTRLTGLIAVVSSASIAQDACVIDSNLGTADAGVSTQLANLESVLSEAARELARDHLQDANGAQA